MKSPDKYLIAIVIGVIALIAVAFSVALLRPKPTYLPEDTPQGIASNYLFALQQGDHERAYGYLSPTIPGYPASLAIFSKDIDGNNWEFSQDDRQAPSLSVDSVKIKKDHATVIIQKNSFYGGGLFSSGESRYRFTMQLIQNTSGAWKIESADEYWAWCWRYEDRC